MCCVLRVFVMVHTSAVLLAWCCVLLRDAASYALRVALCAVLLRTCVRETSFT